jgi:hypothetical protein
MIHARLVKRLLSSPFLASWNVALCACLLLTHNKLTCSRSIESQQPMPHVPCNANTGEDIVFECRRYMVKVRHSICAWETRREILPHSAFDYFWRECTRMCVSKLEQSESQPQENSGQKGRCLALSAWRSRRRCARMRS